MVTNVYIDGFNLYYGSLKGTRFKWLDVSKLVLSLFPGLQINRIRYFTARVQARLHDPDAPVRQDIYLRALKTIPNLTIHEGRFAVRTTLLPQYPLAYIHGSVNRPPQNVQVQKPEEKRSDVNLATMLLKDCFLNDFDEAIVITNDSDLTMPIEVTINDCGKIVRVVNPQQRRSLSRELRQVSTSIIPEINRRHLVNSQFSLTLTDATGNISKPAAW